MTYLTLFWTFFKIGLFTFGGGYAMLPLIQEAVQAHQWMDSGALIDFIAVSESTPGPFAVNIATFIGMRVGGFVGAICATGGVVLPSFLVILIVARFFEKFRQSRFVSGAMDGLKPAVVGLIAAALLSLAQVVFFPAGLQAAVFAAPAFYVSAGIFLLAAVLAFKKAHPILIICLSSGLGVAAGYAFGWS